MRMCPRAGGGALQVMADASRSPRQRTPIGGGVAFTQIGIVDCDGQVAFEVRRPWRPASQFRAAG
jgi:hypothetical protein